MDNFFESLQLLKVDIINKVNLLNHPDEIEFGNFLVDKCDFLLDLFLLGEEGYYVSADPEEFNELFFDLWTKWMQ